MRLLATLPLFVLLIWCRPSFAEDVTGDAKPKKQKGKITSYISSADLVGNTVLGVPTYRSIKANIIASAGMEAYLEFGTASGNYTAQSDKAVSGTGEPILITLSGLKPDTGYFYRLRSRSSAQFEYAADPERTFHTQRKAGSLFSFGVQGDSHPERAGKMYSAELYRTTMAQVVSNKPDFYFTVGDDFSIEGLIEKNEVRRETVESAYLLQREFLGIIGASVPLFCVNGNHEQAARYLLNGTADNPAVFAGLARIKYYPLPVPGDFYRGDTEAVEHIGLLRDYYSWEWGDALFAVIDPYWHSPVAVDNKAGADKGDKGDKGDKTDKGEKGDKKEKKGGGKGGRDGWASTMGDEQYRWLSAVLMNSRAKYKFVFAHHVLGTGRGGVEMAKLYEWGGFSQNGQYDFETKRPQWSRPVHRLFVDSKVTIFFQGHDHVFARQELDGVIYQSLPNPADDTYTAFNRDAYKTGDVLPNSGYVNVTVAADRVKVDYIRTFLPKDETAQNRNGMTAYSYTVKYHKE